MLEVEFVSQRYRIYSEIGCGVASTMMLLKYHFPPDQQPTYQHLAQALNVDIPPEEKGQEAEDGKGVYLEDIIDYFDREKVRYVSTKRKTEKQLSELKNRVVKSPIMVGMWKNEKKWGETGHWIVLIGYQGEKFTYLDPYKKSSEKYKNKIKAEVFWQEWDGTSIQIVV